MSIIWQGEKWICFCLSFFYLVSPLLKVVVFANNVNILSWKHPGTTCIFLKINYYLCWYFYCVNTKWQWVSERCTHSFFKNKVPFHKRRKAQFFFLLWLASDMVGGSCLVPRPHYYARPMRFGSRGPTKFWSPDKLGEVRHFVSLGAELLEVGKLSITFLRWCKISSSHGEYRG